MSVSLCESEWNRSNILWSLFDQHQCQCKLSTAVTVISVPFSWSQSFLIYPPLTRANSPVYFPALSPFLFISSASCHLPSYWCLMGILWFQLRSSGPKCQWSSAETFKASHSIMIVVFWRMVSTKRLSVSASPMSTAQLTSAVTSTPKVAFSPTKSAAKVEQKYFESERVLCYEPDPTKVQVIYDAKVLQVCERLFPAHGH